MKVIQLGTKVIELRLLPKDRERKFEAQADSVICA